MASFTALRTVQCISSVQNERRIAGRRSLAVRAQTTEQAGAAVEQRLPSAAINVIQTHPVPK